MVKCCAWEIISAPPPAIEELPPEQQKDPNILRASAYADPFTGSDRFFLEALRKRAAGDEQGAIDVCTADGTPGTWEIIGTNGGLTASAIKLASPNGTVYKMAVTDAGALTVTPA
jgi:hypothetical protein